MPSVVAVTSWIDNFKIPLKEIKEKYTKSDLALIAWDSRQKSYNLSQGMKPTYKTSDVSSSTANVGTSSKDYVSSGQVWEDREGFYHLPDGVNNGVPVPKKAFNDDGELDLRKMNGPEAAHYIQALGIPLAMMMPKGRKK